jgi:hypothetical protein
MVTGARATVLVNGIQSLLEPAKGHSVGLTRRTCYLRPVTPLPRVHDPYLVASLLPLPVCVDLNAKSGAESNQRNIADRNLSRLGLILSGICSSDYGSYLHDF